MQAMACFVMFLRIIQWTTVVCRLCSAPQHAGRACVAAAQASN